MLRSRLKIPKFREDSTYSGGNASKSKSHVTFLKKHFYLLRVSHVTCIKLGNHVLRLLNTVTGSLTQSTVFYSVKQKP